MPNVPGFIYAEGGKRGRMCLAGQKVLWNSEGNKEVLGTVISDKVLLSFSLLMLGMTLLSELREITFSTL